jgi:ABC-type uncharacterized transport system ATPase subunit
MPEERMRDSAIGDFSIQAKLLLLDNGEPACCKRGYLRSGATGDHCRMLADAFGVKTPDLPPPQ